MIASRTFAFRQFHSMQDLWKRFVNTIEGSLTCYRQNVNSVTSSGDVDEPLVITARFLANRAIILAERKRSGVKTRMRQFRKTRGAAQIAAPLRQFHSHRAIGKCDRTSSPHRNGL